jgi:hypothetical protein
MEERLFNYESKILIVGLVRNASRTLQNDVITLLEAFHNFKNFEFLLVESDSTDSTVQLLTSIKGGLSNFEFLALGNLDKTIPVREDRISYCRNRYLEELRNNPRYSNIEYLVVADMDGINDDLTTKSVESCFVKQDWGACFANQHPFYYDIYALRHPDWSPNDCWKYEKALRDAGLPHVLAREKAVYSRQKRINPNSNWIEVQSAFGGFGIYNVKYLGNVSYSSRDSNGDIICEHVQFHLDIRDNGAKLFINPSLINSRKNPHTSNRHKINRIKWLIKIFLSKVSTKFAKKTI